MPKWIVYSLVSMFFAGLTSVIAKHGLKNISGESGLWIRTCFVFVIISSFLFLSDSSKDLSKITQEDILYLGLSGLTTSISWIFYYKAIKQGNVSVVATIDKASVLITLTLSFILLKEPITFKLIAGVFLIIAGLLLTIWK